MGELSADRRSEIMLSNITDKDCGVIALQAATGWSRRRAVTALRKQGYSDETGTPRGAVERALDAGGFTIHKLSAADLERQTAATFALYNEWGTFLLYVVMRNKQGREVGHVMTLIDGDLHNARGAGMCPLEQVTRVTR